MVMAYKYRAIAFFFSILGQFSFDNEIIVVFSNFLLI